MKAAIVGDKGAEIRDVPKPEPGPNEVLIAARASSLNRADLLASMRAFAGGGGGGKLGLECAGEIEAVGAGVTGFKPGDRVMASCAGGFAQYVTTDAGRVNHIPGGAMSYEQAACLPLALFTMHNAVVTAGRLKRGETLLIQGASSGVGLMGMQIGKLMGASLVIGTSTDADRRARLKDFGCDLALDSARSAMAGGGQESDRRQGRRRHRRHDRGRRRQPESRRGGGARPHRQCRPARRQ